MRCQEARQLFDAYLDGELSPSLATELGAHRVRCADCRRSLALLEVSGHIISSDREPVTVADDFSERLLACVDVRENSWAAKARRTFYFVGPLAAAAVIAMAFLGFFDRGGDSKVAGTQVEAKITQPRGTASPTPEQREAAEQAIDEWISQMRMSRAKAKAGSPDAASDLTILQILEMLKEVNDDGSGVGHFPGVEFHEPFVLPEDHPVEDEDVEDL